MNPVEEFAQQETRRDFLLRAGHGMGALALSSLFGSHATAAGQDGGRGVVDPLHFAPRAKRIIYLCMAGGPSHLETFDYKPELARQNGKTMPESLTAGQPIAQLQSSDLKVLGPQFSFSKHGQGGQEISEVFPHISGVADDICIVRSMVTEQINHDPAHTFMNTGTSISGRPSVGSWLTYGLGSESEDLPGFVVLSSNGGAVSQPISARQWHSGFLPSRFQGVEFQSKGDSVHYIANPAGVSNEVQGDIVDAVRKLGALNNEGLNEPEIAARLSQYEMAFRMQSSVPELVDISDEPEHMLDLYGAKAGDGSYASNCLLARRMAERGVRFIQLYHRGWDHHGALRVLMKTTSKQVDQATGALIADLKQRGMLDDTLVVWGGEFGRTPMAQSDGRDHHIKGFSMFMAGGGIKGGITHGSTDEFGYNAVENVVHVHDLHATMLHLFGIDHKKLTYRFHGRDFRLTDVYGNVVHDILA